MVVNCKPYSATIATPSGWTLVGQSTNGTAASGLSTGSTRVAVFEQDLAGTEGGTTVTLSVTGADSAGAVIHTFTDSLGAWDTTVVAFGNKVGNSANMSATSTTQTSVAAGDLFVIGFAMNASLGTPSADTLTQAGVTFGTVTNRSDVAITTGNDSRNRVDTVPVTSVTTPSGGATAGYTNASATSGTVAFVRLRDIAGGPTQYPAAGTVDATTTATGSTTALLIAAATLAAVTAVTGAATAILPSVGTVAVSSTVAGSATVLKASASGTVAAISDATGSATTRLPASGTVAAVSTVTGSASLIGGPQQYPAAGTVAATTTTAGSATARLAASGTVTAVTTTAGATNARLVAAGTVAGASATTGSASTTQPTAGTVEVISGVTGSALVASEEQPTPPERTMYVAAERRAVPIPAEERTIAAVTTTRTIAIQPESRTLVA